MTVARYWPVGATTETTIPFTPKAMSDHLMQDWIPKVPSLGGHLLMGWPSILTEPYTAIGTDYLALKDSARETERQWKGFMSWMLGVCGARQVCAAEGYDWIAPASAFYPNAVVQVGHADPPQDFVATALKIEPDPTNPSRNRPDYIAVRGPTSATPWDTALVEAKGTSDSLANLVVCPEKWSQQARNAIVSYDGRTIGIDRHMVIAVRSAPNPASLRARRFQIRVWNSEERVGKADARMLLDVVSASLFGVCRNLGLSEVASAISVGNLVRRQRLESDVVSEPLKVWRDRSRARVDRELGRPQSIVRTGTEVLEARFEDEALEMIRSFVFEDDTSVVEKTVVDAQRRLASKKRRMERDVVPLSPLRIERFDDDT
jgi:hypothetical protein